MKKATLAIILSLVLLFALTGCFKRYDERDIDKAADQLSIQQNLDSMASVGTTYEKYDTAVNEADKSFNAFNNSSASSNLPIEIVEGLKKHLNAHKQAKLAWFNDNQSALDDYNAALDAYTSSSYAGSAPSIDDYYDKYSTVQDAWTKVPSLENVVTMLKDCRKHSK